MGLFRNKKKSDVADDVEVRADSATDTLKNDQVQGQEETDRMQSEKYAESETGTVGEKVPKTESLDMHLTGEDWKTYLNFLGDTYVTKKNLELEENEYDRLSLTECAELLRLFSYFHTKIVPEKSLEEHNKHGASAQRMILKMLPKFLEEESMYVVFSKKTGEPHLFSKTIKQGEKQQILCTPPNIRMIPAGFLENVKAGYKEDEFEFRLVNKGEDGNGILNFLKDAFYINGADGVEVISEYARFDKVQLVTPPDFSKLEPAQVPVTNPGLMKWMLLIIQLGRPDTQDKTIIFNIYNRFMCKEVVKARFIMPMKKGENFPEADPADNGKLTIPKGAQFTVPQMEKPEGRNAMFFYTDWRRLKEEWPDYEGMVETMDHIMEKNDVVVNRIQTKKGIAFVFNEENYKRAKKVAES